MGDFEGVAVHLGIQKIKFYEGLSRERDMTRQRKLVRLAFPPFVGGFPKPPVPAFATARRAC